MKLLAALCGVVAAAAAQEVTVDGKPASAVSGYGESHARIEAPAPDFTAEAVMPNGKIETIKLSDYKGKWVVLLFYPLDFTFVCPTEILAFSDRAEELTSINTEILAISVDSKWTHFAWTETPRDQGGLGKVNIPLVADLTREISKAYGVLLPHAGHSLRGLFIIDPEGVLRQVTMNQPPVGRSFDETLRLVQAFQHHAKVGEVCPLGWKPGDDTIEEDAKGKMKFFKKHH